MGSIERIFHTQPKDKANLSAQKSIFSLNKRNGRKIKVGYACLEQKRKLHKKSKSMQNLSI